MEKENENIKVVVGLTLFTFHHSLFTNNETGVRRQETGNRKHESRVTNHPEASSGQALQWEKEALNTNVLSP